MPYNLCCHYFNAFPFLFIFGNRSTCQKLCNILFVVVFPAPPVPECEIRRQLVLGASNGELRVALTRKDIQFPRCNSDGSFSKIQCWAATGQCWCVDKDGNEIQGTRSSASKPKCPKREFFYPLLVICFPLEGVLVYFPLWGRGTEQVIISRIPAPG